ncbi:prefoldin subunit 5-like isoform X2 [Actinia tenebrosa]|uniref:Prefoldin subunit 5-like isoform X1 n=1 Tax=Actinia tenebrosa TaxID=6105 RepID=A0A6P8HGW3_ACTTE|nr:prefoldin subunit 5-like isoform X1 [Actinia tenebrosa]XP_031551839.1 prefoldin subunit 5-like isoform X2 [Actinia tenebrosa]
MAQQTVEISQLAIPHLEALRGQLEEEIKLLSDSMGQLKVAQQKFKDSKENVVKLSLQDTGKPILVPLSSSMYVPGTLENIKSVIVDIGTGYFAEKDLKEAEVYFQRKMDFVTNQIEKLQPVLIEKHKMRQAIIETMNMKIQAQLQNQGGVPATT